MRAILIMLLIALAGCTTIRKSLGDYQNAAEKGAAVNTDTPRDDKRAPLPGGLGGDKANAAYTASTPQD